LTTPSVRDNFPLLCLIKKWKETYELSFELADVTYTLLNSIIDYCKAHDIPINEEKGLWNLVIKSRSIFATIEQINSASARKLLSDEILHDNRSDEDFTEPRKDRFIRNTPT
jgi:hypothetical protein